MKLFRAYSVVDGYAADNGQSYEGVRVGCFVLDRREPIGPYEEMVSGHDKRDACLESVANELFTGNQVATLRGYLRERYGIGQHIA
jgi:hypothetical protein